MLSKSKRVTSSRAVENWTRVAALVFCLLCLAAIGYVGYLAADSFAWAQDTAQAPADNSTSQPTGSTEKRHPARLAIRKFRAQQAARALPAVAVPNFAARLQQAGATKCAQRIDQLAAASMQGTTATADASNWFVAAPNERPVNIVIAQKFAARNVPFGATDIFASPGPDARCDAVALQVIPSPLPCEKLRQAIASHGKMIAELVGEPLLQDSNGQIMLVPTAANACVLIGVRIAYAR
jgi:hypothetical protein